MSAPGSGRHRAAVPLLAAAALVTSLLTIAAPAATATPAANLAGTVAPGAVTAPPSEVAVAGLVLKNSFVSSVGWVKPGQEYPSRLILSNTTDGDVSDVQVTATAPTGSSFLDATSSTGSATADGDSLSWSLDVPARSTVTLVVTSRADSLSELATIVWRDLSSTARLTVGESSETATSHGPKVIPPGEAYDTARYGDRPFPVVPVAYTDRDYQSNHRGGDLDAVINSPDVEGSTFNLFQEMSLGQLFPEGTVPSSGIGSADFSYEHGFEFSKTGVLENPDTCLGGTFADTPLEEEGTPAYPHRISDGVYQLPGSTGYYGSDGAGSGLIGALTGISALMRIDSGCGPTGKLVYDAAVIADPEIDYSDYDTDKDGVVDFFMAVFAGCGGHGASQLTVATCPYPDAPYDNVWPHSSSLEYYYTDPETGLPGYTTDDQLKDLEDRPLFYTSADRTEMTTDVTDWPVFVRVGPYNVNPETAIDHASVISHEYGHSLGLPDFYSLGSRDTYGDWNLMATDKSQNMDIFSRQELGWVVPQLLEPGTSPTVEGWVDSKQDIDTITWQAPDGTPYTLTEGADGRVQNSQAYVAKLPGRTLLTEEEFNKVATGDEADQASPTHTWWSGSGNDFGCASDGGGHNIDLWLPELADLEPGTSVELAFKSMFDIEWDYDYGFVLTSPDGGETFTSNASTGEFPTTSTSNPNANGCQATYSNGISGTSTSYANGTSDTDRLLGEYPSKAWITDRFDVSDLAGASAPVLRFSYATDPGLARPGWFIDDVTLTATAPDGTETVVYATDFEETGGPDDSRVFNGGCQGDGPGGACTEGWTYVNVGTEAPADHAYYLEMRDRSGFDFDGKGQNDREDIDWAPGLSLVYTDEAHGYGNVGTGNPPAQSPLDSQPDPGDDTPDLSDAAWTAAEGDATFTDFAEFVNFKSWVGGHTDNYDDPAQTAEDSRYPDEPHPWRFLYNCLSFDVTAMSGEDVAPEGNLTGDVAFTMGEGCGVFDHGYGDVPPPPANTAPEASAVARPDQVLLGQQVLLDARASTDAETPNELDYSWDLGNGGSTKDAAGPTVQHTYAEVGEYTATVTVTDPQGAVDTASVTVTVTEPDNRPPKATMSAPSSPMNDRRVQLSAADSTDPDRDDLTYSWDFGDGGSAQDATGAVVRTRFGKAGPRRVTLTVTDPDGASDTVSKRIVVRRELICSGKAVTDHGSWRTVRAARVRGGSYCDNLGTGRGKDVLRTTFRGGYLDVFHGRARRGGVAVVFVDGEKVGKVRFHRSARRVRMTHHKVFRGLGDGRHDLKLVVRRGAAYVDGFIVKR